MITIKEIKTNMGNNESLVAKGVYFNKDTNEYHWLTYTRSGFCKKLKTALLKAGF